MIDTVEDGSTVEVGITATREWFDKAIVQISGTAMRMYLDFSQGNLEFQATKDNRRGKAADRPAIPILDKRQICSSDSLTRPQMLPHWPNRSQKRARMGRQATQGVFRVPWSSSWSAVCGAAHKGRGVVYTPVVVPFG
jgi:hypothetical protein